MLNEQYVFSIVLIVPLSLGKAKSMVKKKKWFYIKTTLFSHPVKHSNILVTHLELIHKSNKM